MHVVADDNAAAFTDRVLAFLLRNPVSNNVAIQQIVTRASGEVPTEDGALWLAAYQAEELESVALRTPPYNVLLTAASAEAVTALTAWCVEHAPHIPGVNGPVAAADAFAERWAALTGANLRAVTASRLFHLDRVIAPRPVPGELRRAKEAEADLILTWVMAFYAEAVPHESTSIVGPMVARKLAAGDLWLWCDGDPTAMLWTNPTAAGVNRVSGVFTPPELRGRGYASAAVAAVSQVLLDRGEIPCLFTDLANPTSNRIYQAIGYRPVQDNRQWLFS